LGMAQGCREGGAQREFHAFSIGRDGDSSRKPI
jgi:hypothetical protein